MNKLDMIKAFAELEGLEVKTCELDGRTFLAKIENIWYEYNPITDHSLAFKAMFDYDVEINRYYDAVFIFSDTAGQSPIARVWFSSIEELSYEIIECILKSKSKWS